MTGVAIETRNGRFFDELQCRTCEFT